MNGQWTELALGGLDERLLADAEHGLRVENLVWDTEGFWEQAPGLLEVTAFTPGSGEVASLHWFEPRPGFRFLLCERRGNADLSAISLVSWPSGVPVTIDTRRRLDAHSVGVQFADNGRWTYMFSGTGSPRRFDGRRVAPVGWDGPAPSVRANGPDQGFDEFDHAAGTYPATFSLNLRQRGLGQFVTSGTAAFAHGYVLTGINDLGQESPPSAVVYLTGETDVASGKRLARLTVPRFPDGTRIVRLWRTTDLGSAVIPGTLADVRLHSEWPIAGGFDLIDSTPDAELGVPLDRDSVGPVPRGARAVAFWQSHSWWGGMPSEPTRLRYSTVGLVEQVPEVNYLEIGSAATGSIVALRAYGRVLLVFKTGGVYAVKGNASVGYTVTELSSERGCAAPRAIAILPELGAVFFVDRTGPQLLVGTLDDDQTTKVVPLVGEIRRTWRRKVGANLEAAVAAYDPERSELWLQVPVGGDPRLQLGLVYHVLLETWSVRTRYPVACLEFFRGRMWAGSWKDADYPGIYAVSAASRSRAGEAVVGVYHTRPKREAVAWTFTRVELVGQATLAPFDVATVTDKRTEEAQATDLQPRQLHPDDEARPAWGTATWSTTELWSDYDVTAFPVSVRVPKGFEQEVRISAERVMMTALRLETDVEPGVRRERRERHA